MKSKTGFIRISTIVLIASSFIFLILQIVFAQSAPTGPNTLTIQSNGRYSQNNQSGQAISAQAGNVTEFLVSQRRATEAWQGYYGNITGTITLDDANNQTLYDWSLPNPTGEVFASTVSAVDWTNVTCLNVSHLNNGCNPSGCSQTNNSVIEAAYGINITDHDGLNETFNGFYTDATGFYVGAINFNIADACSMANPYTDEGASAAWQEVLLIAAQSSSLIFTSIVRENANDFKATSTTADFQMLVLENGHVGSEITSTPYWFFVELS